MSAAVGVRPAKALVVLRSSAWANTSWATPQRSAPEPRYNRAVSAIKNQGSGYYCSLIPDPFTLEFVPQRKLHAATRLRIACGERAVVAAEARKVRRVSQLVDVEF